MTSSLERVKSVEITNAVRDTRTGNLQIKKGDFIGIIDGNIKVASGDLNEAIFGALEAVDAGKAEIVSLFYGDQTDSSEAADLSWAIKERYPGLEIEVIQGGQPHYPFIMSVE